MKKGREIFTIITILAFVLGVGLFVAFNGIKANDNHYVRIEVNPKVEFITNKNNKVVSVLPINEEATTLLIQEKLLGLNIEDACQKFIELCTEANYIDVDGEKNAIRLTIISGFTQALENRIYIKINNFFKESEIKAIIVESDNDIDLISSAQEKNVSSANKLILINSILDKSNKNNFEKLSKKSESELIDLLLSIHQSQNYDCENFTAEEISNKTKLLDFNREKYEKHLQSITNSTLSEFSETYEKFKNKYQDDYEENYDEKYNTWIRQL